MSYLVIELQRDALNPNISVTNLLRKALVVAKKLNLGDFDHWVNLELNGYYEQDSKVPKYRHVIGQLKGLNPFSGWMPTSFGGNNELEKTVTNRDVGEKISELEYLISSEKNDLCITFPSSVEQQLNRLFSSDTKFQLFVDKSQFHGILEAVRTTILNWALQLECDGILGDEMIFSQQERAIADSKNYTVNYFYGDVNNSQIQQHTTDSQQG
jgi:hypothetical protein